MNNFYTVTAIITIMMSRYGGTKNIKICFRSSVMAIFNNRLLKQ